MIEGIIISIIIVSFLILICNENSSWFTVRRKVCNDKDQRCYEIVEKFSPDSYDEASKMLAHLNAYCLKILRHMRNKYV